MTIYIDVILLENMFMNSIIIIATCIILRSKIHLLRILLSSFIGSIYAILTYITNIDKSFILKIILSLVIVLLAFKPQSRKSFLKHLIIFYLTSFTFGGAAFALIYLINPIKIEPVKIALIGGILGFTILVYSFKNIQSVFSRKNLYCKIRICKKEITAIIDTGNLLKEPITRMPVIIIEKTKLQEIFPEVILNNIQKIINGENINLGEYASKIKVIPFKSLGKENGLILGIKTDEVEIEFQDICHEIQNVIIGIYDGKLSKKNNFFALVGANLLN